MYLHLRSSIALQARLLPPEAGIRPHLPPPNIAPAPSTMLRMGLYLDLPAVVREQRHSQHFSEFNSVTTKLKTTGTSFRPCNPPVLFPPTLPFHPTSPVSHGDSSTPLPTHPSLAPASLCTRRFKSSPPSNPPCSVYSPYFISPTHTHSLPSFSGPPFKAPRPHSDPHHTSPRPQQLPPPLPSPPHHQQ